MNITDQQLEETAEKYGTPTYVYDLGEVRQRLRILQEALPGADVRYALKANSAVPVLRLMAENGAGAEAITRGELHRALDAGIQADRILVGGPAQGPDLRSAAREAGVTLVSLDSESQWEDWQAETGEGSAPDFLVRVNPALDPRTHRHLATGSADSKFGLLPDAAARLAGELQEAGRFTGFHVHAGSQIGDLDVFRGVLDVLEPLLARYPGRILNLGGGWRVPDFPLPDYAELVTGFAARHGLRLMVEPGRFLTAEAGVLLSRVLHVKRGGPVTHVIADAGMADLVRPALYDARHSLRLLRRDGTGPLETVDVDGPLCENADRLGRQVELPAPRKGDLLVVGEAGAYGYGMASNYASSLRPAEVVVDGGEIILSRGREEPADLLSRVN